MCALLKEIKQFQQGGLNFDNSVEYRPPNDYWPAYNIRPQGVAGLDEGYITNIPSNEQLSASTLPGISRCIGSAGFESAGIGLYVYYNSASHNELREINYATNVVTRIPITNWNLDPNHYVNDIRMINNEFLLMNDNYNPPFYINYNRLKAGEFGDPSVNDMMLQKPQPQYPPAASYISDTSRASNFLAQKEFQFRTVWQGLDYELSNVSTISARFVPPFESVPGQSPDTSVNNAQIVQVPVGDITRLSNVIVYARFALLDWFQVQEIDIPTLLALPKQIDLSNQINQAYDPIANTYTFIFYNDGLYPNIDPTITDQLYDNVPQKAGALEILNGDQIVLGDITTGYAQPNTPILFSSSNYNPNIQLSPSVMQPPLEYTIINPGQTGSGEGNHKRLVVIEFGGYVQENDYVIINMVDIRNSANVQSYRFSPATFGQVGNTFAYIGSNAAAIPYASLYTPTDGQIVGVNIITSPYFTLQSVFIFLYNAGAGIYKSIPALKGNSGYQPCLMHYDYWGRPFPLQILPAVRTDSYGQSHGNTPQINWQIQNATAPQGAYTYQIGLSPNTTHLTWLQMFASIVQVAGNGTGTYTASNNVFSPSEVGATAGQAWRVATPGSQNLGNGLISFNIGDWVVAQGNNAFQQVPSTYGDLSDSTCYYFYFNTLENYDNKYSASILTYGFSPGDRATLYYFGNNGTMDWFDGLQNPIVDVQVEGYDAGVFFLKTSRNANVDPSTLLGQNIFLEVYTPKPRTDTTANVTTNNETVFFELGTAYQITNGLYSQLTGAITRGDNYFKTRQIGGSVDINVPYYLVVEDPNYSDFYISNYYSFGRARAHNDVLPVTRQIANIVYSQPYVIGGQNNGLITFYVADIYGDGAGQTSSSFGAIVKLLQINNYLIALQQDNHGSIPVYQQIWEDQQVTQTAAVAQQILGPIRYTLGKHIGVGTAKESIAVYNNIIYWVDSNRNEPIRWEGAGMGNGALAIGEKMTKYFRQALQEAFVQGLKIIGWYDIYNDEYVIAIQQPGGISISFPFNAQLWATTLPFVILPGQITIATNPLHSSPSYNNITGICVITPSTNYIGSDSFIITTGTSPSRNVCYSWTPGSGSVYAFSFIPQTGVPLNTEIQSNFISVGGNDYPVAISITGDAGLGYSINGGAFTSSPGTVNNGDSVQVQVTSASGTSSLRSCTLTIDGQSATFNVTTFATGNLMVQAKYGITILNVSNGSATISPAAPGDTNLSSGNSGAYVYSGITAGTINVTISGEPGVSPGHVQLYLSVAGVTVDFQSVISSKSLYQLSLGSPQTNPTIIVVGVQLV